MKSTKYILTLLLSVFFISKLLCQYSDDTIHYGFIQEITPQLREELNLIPELVLTQESLDTELAYKSDNSKDIDMKGMPSGIYFYSMYIDGQLADSKKMVVK